MNETEEMRMVRWREAVCVELGVSPAVTAAIVAIPIDIAEFRKLVGAGCDPAVALEILSP